MNAEVITQAVKFPRKYLKTFFKKQVTKLRSMNIKSHQMKP